MEPPPEAPQPGSAARTWLRILAWCIPGVTAPALLLGAVLLSYGNPGFDSVALIGFFVILVALVVGCGVFDNLLHIDPPPAEGEPARNPRKFKGGRFTWFFLLQFLLTPAIGFASGTACTYVFSL